MHSSLYSRNVKRTSVDVLNKLNFIICQLKISHMRILFFSAFSSIRVVVLYVLICSFEFRLMT